MPEGPEVRRMADSLNKLVSGTILTKIIVNARSKYFNKSAFENFQESKIVEVKSIGKKIIFVLEDGNYLISALSMTGRWQRYSGDHSGVELIYKGIILIDGVKEVLGNDCSIFFDDVDRRGRLDYVNESEYVRMMKAVGPDLLSRTVTLEDYKAKITNKRIKNNLIADYLLDQKRFSGVGNYLRAEILYKCRISPYRKLENLSEEDTENLYNYSISVLEDSYLNGGFTMSRYLSIEGKHGTYRCVIYNCKKDPEDNDIEVIVGFGSAKRTIHWVPEVQV